ncbi:MAG TPA: SAM-dependent methyltransferase [Trebonia sp.]|nr:SAM-dependent methyltransferase [Trebonia sp.]
MALDMGVPNAARVYDFFLGGKDNFAADRELAQKILAILPDTADVCQGNREFMQRAVRFLAGEAGIRQFLDIGAGLPTMGNVHEPAQEVAPGARVAYVDYDPVVLSHARALLANDRDVIAVEGDLRAPEAILADPALAQLIDFSQPVAVLLVAILHFVLDADRPQEAVRALVSALPPGSYLVLTHSTPDDVSDDVTEAMKSVYSNASAQVAPRSFDEIAAFFDGLELVDPGLVNVALWRPDLPPHRPSRPPARSLIYGGVGMKAR